MFMVSISFSCVIAVARISNTMLNKRSESRFPILLQLCLVSDLKGNTCVFFPIEYNVGTGVRWALTQPPHRPQMKNKSTKT